MQNFFHADTSGYRNACKKASVATGAVLALPALLCLMSLIIQTRNWRTDGFVATRLIITVLCVALWLAVTFLMFFICETRARRITRSTYFEIQKSALILSRYGGRIAADTGGTQRKLWIIPFENLKISMKNGRLTFTGNIKYYEGDTDRLGYHIRRGKPEFDNWWLNSNGFTEVKAVTLPSCFTKPKTVFRYCKLAQKRYILQCKKKNSVSKPVSRPKTKMVYRQARRRTYTELPTFDRKW